MWPLADIPTLGIRARPSEAHDWKIHAPAHLLSDGGDNPNHRAGASNTVGPGKIMILGLSKSWPRLPWHSLHPGNLDRPVAPSAETVRPSRNDERPYGPYPSDTGTRGYSDLFERIASVERRPIRALRICNRPIRACRPYQESWAFFA